MAQFCLWITIISALTPFAAKTSPANNWYQKREAGLKRPGLAAIYEEPSQHDPGLAPINNDAPKAPPLPPRNAPWPKAPPVPPRPGSFPDDRSKLAKDDFEPKVHLSLQTPDIPGRSGSARSSSRLESPALPPRSSATAEALQVLYKPKAAGLPEGVASSAFRLPSLPPIASPLGNVSARGGYLVSIGNSSKPGQQQLPPLSKFVAHNTSKLLRDDSVPTIDPPAVPVDHEDTPGASALPIPSSAWVPEPPPLPLPKSAKSKSLPFYRRRGLEQVVPAIKSVMVATPQLHVNAQKEESVSQNAPPSASGNAVLGLPALSLGNISTYGTGHLRKHPIGAIVSHNRSKLFRNDSVPDMDPPPVPVLHPHSSKQAPILRSAWVPEPPPLPLNRPAVHKPFLMYRRKRPKATPSLLLTKNDTGTIHSAGPSDDTASSAPQPSFSDVSPQQPLAEPRSCLSRVGGCLLGSVGRRTVRNVF